MVQKRLVKSQPSSSSAAAIPAPFTPAPARLTPFLSLLDPSKVYITHIDTHPAELKRRIFTVPVVLNLVIAALLAWRFVAAVPWYTSLLSTVRITTSTRPFSSPPSLVDNHAAQTRTTSSLILLVLSRSAVFMFDFCLFRLVGPWPVSFFLERPSNPVQWRWTVGFRPREIIVRESRGWGGADLLSGARRGGESPFFATRVRPAVAGSYLAQKTGYLMMGKDYDLSFGAMVRATEMVDAGELEARDFETGVWAHRDGTGWVGWRVEREGKMSEEEQRGKIQALKERLTAMGKESLFFRWIEIVQFESGKPGVFDRKRQEETAEVIKAEFEKQGVDFEQLVKQVGGLDGTPGMER